MFKKQMLGNVDLRSVSRDYAWYAVATQFNYEEAYVRNLVDGAAGRHLEDYIQELYIPFKHIRETVIAKDGTKKEKEKKLKGNYSSYVFVKCILTTSVWNLLRTTTGAAVVLSAGGIPVEISVEEIQKVKEQQAPEGYSEEEIKERKHELEGCIIYNPVKPEVTDADFI